LGPHLLQLAPGVGRPEGDDALSRSKRAAREVSAPGRQRGPRHRQRLFECRETGSTPRE
jgi:hypothetical protein